MRPKFRTPDEVAQHAKTEKISLNVAKAHMHQLKILANERDIPVSSLINEAIRAYCEFLEEIKREPGI